MGMRVDEPYGAALRDYFRLKIPVPAVGRTFHESRFAVAHISLDESDHREFQFADMHSHEPLQSC
jgi:hypothetical protein